MPLTRRVPKRGFSNAKFKNEIAIVNIDKLNKFRKGSVITLDSLKKEGLVKNKYSQVKLLGNGELKKELTVKIANVSRSAREKIEAAGGKVEEL